MKKYFILFYIFLLYVPRVVFADVNLNGLSMDNRGISYYDFYDSYEIGDYYANQIVQVEKVNFVDTSVEIEGYSFIPNQDNYGCFNGDGINKCNIKTYIVASIAPESADSDIGKNWYGTGNAWSWNNWGKNNLVINDGISCKNDKNCYIIDVDVVERDFFGARCSGDTCSYKKEFENYRLENGFNNNFTCSLELDDTIEFDSGGKTDYSACLYHNVGFKVSFDLFDITEKFENVNKEGYSIRFFVVTINTDVLKHLNDDAGKLTNNHGIGFTYTELYVPVENCYIEGNRGCPGLTGNGNFEVETDYMDVKMKYYEETQVNVSATGIQVFDTSYSPLPNTYFYRTEFKTYFDNYYYFSLIGETSYKFVGELYDLKRYHKNIREFTNNGVPYRDAFYEIIAGDVDICRKKSIRRFEVDECDDIECSNLNVNAIKEKLQNDYNYTGGVAPCEIDGEYALCLTDSNSNFISINSGDFYNEIQMCVKYKSSGSSYLIPANVVNIRGSFQIKSFSNKIRNVTCDDLYGEGADNIRYYNDNGDLESSVNCNSADSDVTIEQCSDYNDEGHDVTGYIYVDIDNSIGSECGLNNLNNNMAPIAVNTKVLLHQTGYFRFNKISEQTFSAGKGFEFVSSFEKDIIENNNNTLNYSALLEWSYFMWKENQGVISPHYSLDSVFYNNECVLIDPYELLSNSENVYYKNANGVFIEADTLEDSVFNAIDLAVQSEFYNVTTVTDINDNVDENSKEINENVKFVSCDSNSNKTSCESTDMTDVGGNWLLGKVSAGLRYLLFNNNNVSFLKEDEKVINSVRGGRGSYYSYFYSLPNAYISLIDNGTYNYGDVLYINGLIDESKKNDFYYVGNKYFVGFKYTDKDDEFPFNLANDVNPSLINVMSNWELNGTCNVSVDNGLFDGNGKPLYKYRSISLSNPFPKGNTSLNWRKWHLKAGNLERLSNTYDYDNDNVYDPIYSFTLIKNYGSNGIEIAEINSCSSVGYCSKSYGTFDGLSVDGGSNFVRYYNPWANNKDSYCGLGMFSNKCDAFAGGTILDFEGDIEVENGGSDEGVDSPIIISPITPNPGTGLETS